ncbi:hypothetical protein X975_01755, partial [Stegodyphus mimosarum]
MTVPKIFVEVIFRLKDYEEFPEENYWNKVYDQLHFDLLLFLIRKMVLTVF